MGVCAFGGRPREAWAALSCLWIEVYRAAWPSALVRKRSASSTQ
jgi:hypothetical protein